MPISEAPHVHPCTVLSPRISNSCGHPTCRLLHSSSQTTNPEQRRTKVKPSSSSSNHAGAAWGGERAIGLCSVRGAGTKGHSLLLELGVESSRRGSKPHLKSGPSSIEIRAMGGYFVGSVLTLV